MAPPLTTTNTTARRRASLSELPRTAEQPSTASAAGGSRPQAARSPDGPLRSRSGSTSAGGDPDASARQPTSGRGGPRTALPADRDAAMRQIRAMQLPPASAMPQPPAGTKTAVETKPSASTQTPVGPQPSTSAQPSTTAQPTAQPGHAPGVSATGPAPVAPLHVAAPLGALSPTDVNPFAMTGSLLGKMQRLGATSMEDAVRMTMQSMRNVRGVNISNAHFEQAVQGTLNALRDNGITTMRGFVKEVVGPLRRHALGLSVRQGLMAGTGFNIGAILWDAKLAAPLQEALGQHFPHLSPIQLGAATTAIIAASLYVADVATSYAAGKAHAGAYPTKPGGKNVPASLQNPNPISARMMAAKLAVGADLTYGAREITVRGLGSIGLAAEGKPAAVQADWETGTDGPMGLAAAAGLRVFLNKTDDNAGRSGVQVPMFERGAPGSRTADGGAGIDRFLQQRQRPTLQKVGDAAMSTLKAAGSFVAHVPSGVGYALTSLTGATSATFLVGGLTALNVAANTAKQAMLDRGHSPDSAEAARQTVRMFGLMAVYAMWGGPMGAAAVAEERDARLSGPVPALEEMAKEAFGQA